jgi:hypothetical protein
MHLTIDDISGPTPMPSEVLNYALHMLASGAVADSTFPLVDALRLALKDLPDSASGGHYYLTLAAEERPLLDWLLEEPRSADEQLEVYAKAVELALEAGE